MSGPTEETRTDSLLRVWQWLRPPMVVWLMMLSGMAQAQFVTDCCLQAVRLQAQLKTATDSMVTATDSIAKLNKKNRDIYQTGELLLEEKDGQIQDAWERVAVAETKATADEKVRNNAMGGTLSAKQILSL